MELLREEEQAQIDSVQTEAQKHNALISERYKRLQNAVANQFAEGVYTEERSANNAQADIGIQQQTTYISPNTVNSATYAQMPTVTEYISRASSALFTPERFERMQAMEEEQAIAAPVTAPVVAPVQATAVKMEAQYTLSSVAKLVMAVFAIVIVAMLTLICVNTNAIDQKRANIQLLEERKAELVEENARVQERIEEATSDETIREYAESQGMVQTQN